MARPYKKRPAVKGGVVQKRPGRPGRIPEVFGKTEGDIIAAQNKSIEEFTDRVSDLNNPSLPEFYKSIDVNAESKTMARTNLYANLSRFSPYLIKKLLYLTATKRVSEATNLRAAKILIDKIMPNLEASQVQVNHDVQSLVIVKSTNKDPK